MTAKRQQSTPVPEPIKPIQTFASRFVQLPSWKVCEHINIAGEDGDVGRRRPNSAVDLNDLFPIKKRRKVSSEQKNINFHLKKMYRNPH